MIRPISSGTVEIVDADRRTTVGYGFVEPGVPEDDLHVQRWVLYEAYRAPPVHAVVFRRPEDPARQYALLDDWKAALEEGALWCPGATYVKANCVLSAEIVDVVLPFDEKEFDPGACQLLQGERTVGWEFASTVEFGRASEHWVLLPGYTSPTDEPLTAGPPDPADAAPTLHDFLDRRRVAWVPGSTYVVCACTSFNTLPAYEHL